MDELDLAFFLGLELGLMRIVILLHILVVDGDSLIKIGGLKSNDVHVEFVVAALKIFVELALRDGNAYRKQLLNFIHAKLIANHLFDMLFAEAHWRQLIPHKIGELIHVEPGFALKRRQLAHDIGDLRSVWTKTEPLRFMPQDN